MQSHPLRLGERYVLESPIATGGMATVWRARDDVLARVVAVKVLHEHLAGDPEFVARFRHEALAAARLTHPNIVAIYDSGGPGVDDEATTHNYIVMEYCAGGSLAGALRAEGAMDPERVAALGATICEALAHAHERGVVHRDLKPANVLLAEDRTLKVADFGIAKAAFVSEDLTAAGSLLGTISYLAPEQLQGAEPDARSDLYALGVVLFELLVGRPPFAADTPLATAIQHLRDDPPSLRALRPDIPRPIEQAVMRALARDPSDRYGSADEMRTDLAAVGAWSAATVERPQAPAPRERFTEAGSPRWVIPVIALIATAVALVAFVPGLLRDDGRSDRVPPAPEGRVQVIRPQGATDFDPHGGDGEHPEEAHLAIDQDPGTAWETQTYFAPFDLQGKPGVGLLVDLGRSTEVSRVEVVASPGTSFEVRAADEVGVDESSFDVVGRVTDAPPSAPVDASASARYWLVWITSLPGGTGSAAVAEVSFFGP